MLDMLNNNMKNKIGIKEMNTFFSFKRIMFLLDFYNQGPSAEC